MTQEPPSGSSSNDAGGSGKSVISRVHRHRVLLVSQQVGYSVHSDVDAHATQLLGRIRECARTGHMARMIWADSRLLDPKHPLHSLLPSDDRSSHSSAAGTVTSGYPLSTAGEGGERRVSRWLAACRRLAPWLALFSLVLFGLLIFYLRSL